MSLILEALRKSEAQRRRATVPDVYAELPPAPAGRSRLDASRAVWIALIALLLLALWIARAAFAPAAPATVPEAGTAPVAVQPPSLTPVRHLSPPPSPPRTEPDASMTDKAAVVARPAPPVSRETTSTDSARASTTAAAPAPITPPLAMAAPAATAMSSPAATLSLADLSVDERKALPPLKMSMHLWNDDPAQRLVIIDGNRLHEGDRIGEAVVTAIVSDGVLLDWNGRRLKLPIR